MEKAIQAVKPAVVAIGFTIDDRRQIVGTGFFINEEGFVLTAGHVADVYKAVEASPGLRKQVWVGIPFPDPRDYGVQGIAVFESFRHIRFSVHARDRVNDVAILKLEKNPFKDPGPAIVKMGDKEIRAPINFARVRTQSVVEGEPVGFSGYPLTRNTLITQQGIVSAKSVLLRDQELVELGHEVNPFGPRPEFIAVGAMANVGQSGSPVFDVDGRVIGICKGHLRAPVEGEQNVPGPTQRLWSNAGIGLVIPIRYATDLMKANNIAWQAAHEAPKKAGPTKKR